MRKNFGAKAMLYPMPVLIIGSYDENNVPDAMNAACGDNSVATKRNLVEILRFRHFSRHVVFDAEGDKFRNKRIEDYITVSVVIDMECGNTKKYQR